MSDLTPKTAEQALTLALVLAIKAPTESKKQECVLIAESIAENMTEKKVELCKAAAECVAEFEGIYQ